MIGKTNTWEENFEYEDSMKERYIQLLQYLDNYQEKCRSVLDLGCGPQFLREILPQDILYTGCDLYKHKESTVIVDFNKKQFVEGQWDLCIAGGVLEYIYEMKVFIKNVGKSTKKYFACTYHFEDYVVKRAPIWTPKLWNITDFLKLTDKAGLRLLKFDTPVEDTKKTRCSFMIFEKR